jgi:hypothetical protein
MEPDGFYFRSLYISITCISNNPKKKKFSYNNLKFVLVLLDPN